MFPLPSCSLPPRFCNCHLGGVENKTHDLNYCQKRKEIIFIHMPRGQRIRGILFPRRRRDDCFHYFILKNSASIRNFQAGENQLFTQILCFEATFKAEGIE